MIISMTSFDELIKTNILSADSKLNEQFIHLYKSTWPAFEIGFYNQQQNLNDSISDKVSNVYLAGKTNGKLHTTVLSLKKPDI